MRRMSILVGLVILVLTTTGYADPLTNMLKKNKYAPMVPIHEVQHIGDMYRTHDVNRPPVILMRDLLTSTELDAFMGKSSKDPVQLPVVSGDNKFDLTVKADVIGYVKGELGGKHVRKFKVKVGDAVQYVISEDKFANELYPIIKRKRPKSNFDGSYVVIGLLQAGSLEYELIDGNGAKIAVEAAGDIEKIVKAKLGAEWNANKDKNLSISKASFIGYRIGKMFEGGFRSKSDERISAMADAESSENKSFLIPITVIMVPPDELRKMLESDQNK